MMKFAGGLGDLFGHKEEDNEAKVYRVWWGVFWGVCWGHNSKFGGSSKIQDKKSLRKASLSLSLAFCLNINIGSEKATQFWDV